MRAAFVLFAGWLALAAADANPYAGGVAPTHGEQTLKKQDPSSPQGGGRALMTYSGPVLQVMPSPYTSTNPGIGYVCQYYIGSGAGLEWVDIDRHPKKNRSLFSPHFPLPPSLSAFPPFSKHRRLRLPGRLLRGRCRLHKFHADRRCRHRLDVGDYDLDDDSPVLVFVAPER